MKTKHFFMNSKQVALITSFAVTSALSGCDAVQVASTPAALSSVTVASIDGVSTDAIQQAANTAPMRPIESLASNAVCDPFGLKEVVSSQNGLSAQLYYLDSAPQFSCTQGYFDYGHLVDADLFLNQLNVPTRNFDQGFMSQNGEMLKKDSGSNLFEYFALKIKGQIALGANDQPGLYQFALLSDDGSILNVDDAMGHRTVINNDGDHATKMGCAHEAIEFNAQTRLPIEVLYHQGPRYHISLMLLWRHVDASQNLNDTLCDVAGNDIFFKSGNSSSVPLQAFKDLQARGWSVLNSNNYLLPTSESVNPCTGSCYTDRFVNPQWNVFAPTLSGIDVSSIRVTLNGKEVEAIYDPGKNLILIPALNQVAETDEIHIGYCLAKAPIVVASPSPSPSPSPTVVVVNPGVLGI